MRSVRYALSLVIGKDSDLTIDKFALAAGLFVESSDAITALVAAPAGAVAYAYPTDQNAEQRFMPDDHTVIATAGTNR